METAGTYSQWPMESSFYEAETMCGSRTQQFIENKIPFGGQNVINYYTLTEREGKLHENVALQDIFADFNNEPPQLRIFVLGYEKQKIPLKLMRHYYIPLSKNGFIRLLENAAIPPIFVDVHTDNNGVYTAHPSHLSSSRCPESFHLFVRYPNTSVTWSSLYYRYDVLRATSTMLIIGTHAQRYQTRVQELYHKPAVEQGQSDLFGVVATIVAEVSAMLEEERRGRDLDVQAEESKTGFAPMRSIPPTNANSIAIGSTRSLHTVLGHLRFLHRLVDFQVCLIEFMTPQHESLTRIRISKCHESQNDPATIEDFAEKTRRILNLTLSSTRTRLKQIDELIYKITAQIRIVDNIVMQNDSRATIAIAEQAQRTAIDTKERVSQ
ncbi:MAG: hypothetical protein Q9226_004060 [Calogaya cf. arnoldii]